MKLFSKEKMKEDGQGKLILKRINLDFKMDVGAPTPTIISNEYKLFIMFYINKPDPNWDGTYVNVRDTANDEGIACFSFKKYCQFISGWPNEDVCTGHRYGEIGLEPYEFFEVINSEWIEDIMKKNRVHPYHKDEHFSKDRHFILYFHDSCFEIIAEDYEIEVFQDKSMKEISDLKLEELF